MTSPSPSPSPSSYVEKPSPSPSDPPPDPTAPAGNGKMLGQYYPGLAESCRRAYRLAWSFYFVTGAYIDLSVTPRAGSP